MQSEPTPKILSSQINEVFRKEDGIRLAKRIGAVAYLEIDASEENNGAAEVANVLAWTAHTMG